MIETCIVILNLNTKDFTKNCLESLKKFTNLEKNKVIIVDNGSTDGSQKMIKSKYKEVDLIENKENRGFGGGCNDGAFYAIKKYSPEYLFFLNNDTLITDKNWLESSVRLIKRHNQIGIVGSILLGVNGKKQRSVGWIHPFGVKYYFGEETKEVNWVSATFLIKASLFKKLNGFDESYFPAYYEETDFETRLRKLKLKVIVNPKSRIIHFGGETTKKIFEEKNQKLIFYRNRFKYFLSHHGYLFFIPRLLIDFLKSTKNKELPILIKAYKEYAKQYIF